MVSLNSVFGHLERLHVRDTRIGSGQHRLVLAQFGLLFFKLKK